MLTLPLKLLTSPLLFLKGYLSSLFVQPPMNLFMLFIYPILAMMKTIPGAISILAPLAVVIGSPVLIPLFALLSPILTPLVTLVPYTLKVFGSMDHLAVQLLQLLNGIPALTNSFFLLRIISKIIPLPFTTTIGCLNTAYDLVHRIVALPFHLPGVVSVYQMFNLLIIPNGLINALLSPVYAVIFGVGSMITGMAKVLCIPELIQITMLALMLPVLLISFIMQTPSRFGAT